jgi:pimeloyl-ACP methyl ester carboxylesterase
MNHSYILRSVPLILSLCSCSSNLPAASPAGPDPALAVPPPPEIIVMGFVGGFVRHNDSVHQEVQLADRLRKDYPSGVDVSVFANHQGQRAHDRILRLLDTGHHGTLSAEEKREARVILYGHSWGASEALAMARALQKDGVPVLLTIQVDSVAKPGGDDRFIPENVDRAANFFQLNGVLHGQRRIEAINPRRTRILGNFQFDYRTNPVNCDGYPWYAQLFMKPHIEIESDPRVWNRVDSLIRSELSPATASR